MSLACLLLVALASTAQAVHTHGVALPDRTQHAGKLEASAAPADESVCPLCVAMHSALPVAASHAPLPLPLTAGEMAPWIALSVSEPEHFAGFSRPPPGPRSVLEDQAR